MGHLNFCFFFLSANALHSPHFILSNLASTGSSDLAVRIILLRYASSSCHLLFLLLDGMLNANKKVNSLQCNLK